MRTDSSSGAEKAIKRILIWTVIAVVMAAFSCFIVRNEADAVSISNGSAQVNSSSGAWLRKSASTSSSKVKLLSDNTKLTITREVFKSKTSTSAKNKWYKVKVGGKTGYIRADCVDNVKYTGVSAVTTAKVNYRTGAGTKMTKKGTLKKGAKVTVYMAASPVSSTAGTSKTWYRIKFNNKYYYMSSKYIKLTGTSSTSKTAAKSSGTNSSSSSSKSSDTSSSASTGTDFSKMTNAQFNAYLTKQGFPSSYRTKLLALHKKHPNWVFIAKKTGINWNTAVSKESANGVSLIHSSYPVTYRATDSKSFKAKSRKIYTSASTSKSTGKTISSGTNFTVLTEEWKGTTQWTKIKYSGTTGYISGSLASQTYKSTISGKTTDDVNIRKGAGTNNSYIKTLSTGTKVKIVLQVKDKNGDAWYKIKNGTGYAYIKAEFVKVEGSKKPASLTGTATFLEGTWIAKDGSTWFNANSQTVAYYMDPRNFLTDEGIYMFEDLTYHKEYQTTAVVNKILSPTKLPGYGFKAKLFVNAGASYNISPVFLASRARQETGNGSIAISGYKYLGKVVYNPFNIGAYSSSNPVMKGLAYARVKGWTTQAKAVNGGAKFLAEDYISIGQNSVYFQKFNVGKGSSYLAKHQYMTNITGAVTESQLTKSSYETYKITGEALTFVIPVYNNMPGSTSLPN